MESDEVRVLQLNLWNINEPLGVRMALFERGLNEFEPDVVAVQEVSFTDDGVQTAGVARAAGYNHYFVDAGVWQGRAEGLAILSRHPIVDMEVVRLPCSSADLQRVVQMARVQPISGRGYWIVNTHLAFPIGAHEARKQQARRIRSLCASLAGPLVLAGDLNDVPESHTLAELTDGLVDSWSAVNRERGLTFSSSNGYAKPELGLDRRIDYVLVSRHWRIGMCELVFDSEPFVSDHFGVLCSLSFVDD